MEIELNNNAVSPSHHNFRIHNEECIAQNTRNYWETAGHCSTLMFPTSYPEIFFDSESCNMFYQQYITNCMPERELVGLMRQTHYNVLKRLNDSKLQVRNFILPVKLIKLKYFDPFSRQKIIKEICRYLSSQKYLRNVVFEQAEVTFADLCRLLLSISSNAKVRRLYLWHVLEPCQSPFRGPLQSDIIFDDLPRIPFTHNPGGRKFLKQVEQKKLQEKPCSKNEVDGDVSTEKSSETTKKSESLVAEDFQLEHKTEDLSNAESVATEDTSNTKNNLGKGMIKSEIEFCISYLKLHENHAIDIDVLREMYKIALKGLTHVKTLSLNYSLLADGTGTALMSIGSLLRGTLIDLELLCLLKDLPSATHKQYDEEANHDIPDTVWTNVKKICPNLKVHMILVSLLPNDVTKMFITKSMPLYTFNITSAFCTTLIRPQIAFFSTLSYLRHYFKQTLRNVNILIWHSSGRIDGSLETFIKETDLHSFVYYGPLQYKVTISKLCDAALLPGKKIQNFRLVVRGDPCYPHIAKELTTRLYEQYKPKFSNRNIQFMLCSSGVS